MFKVFDKKFLTSNYTNILCIFHRIFYLRFPSNNDVNMTKGIWDSKRVIYKHVHVGLSFLDLTKAFDWLPTSHFYANYMLLMHRGVFCPL